MAKETGRVVQIQGGVVDVAFPEGNLPELYEAIEVERPGEAPLFWKYKNTWAITGCEPSPWLRRMAFSVVCRCERPAPRSVFRLARRPWAYF
jgi:hypothetical protein